MMCEPQPSYDELLHRCQAAEAQLASMNSSDIATVLESMSDAFFTLDSNLIVTYFNGAAARVLGRNVGEVLGKQLFDAFPEARGSIFEERYREAILTSRPIIFETYFDVPPYCNWYEVRVYPHMQGIAVYFVVSNERKQAEEKLRENEARLQLALDSGHLGMWEWDVQKNRSIWNHSEYELFGIPVGDGYVDTDLFFRHLHPEDAEAFIQRLDAVMAEGTEWTDECRFIRPDGEICWLEGTGHLIRDEDGKPLRMIGINKDITERKEAEAAHAFLLKCGLPGTGEDFFPALARYLAETLSVGYVCIDRLVGDGLTAQTVAIYHDGHFDSNVSYALKDTPCGKVVGEGVCCFPREVCQLFPDDADLQALQAESYIGTTLCDMQGQPIGLIALIDRKPLVQPKRAALLLKLVAPRAAGELERRQAEQALRDSEDRFRLLTTLAPVSIYLTNAEGRCVYANPKWCEIAGFGLEEARGFGWVRGLHPDDREIVIDKWQKMLDSEGQWGLEYRFRTPNGRITWVYGLAAPNRDADGKIIGYVGVNTDITAQKLADEERKHLQSQLQHALKMESVGRLAGGVAHDFNNMLGVILGNTELALQQLDTISPVHADLVEIKHAAERSADLTRQLLAFARKQAVAPKVINLNEAIAGMLKMLRRLIGENILLSWQPGTDLGLVYLDPAQIDQILVNLSVNAHDAIHGNGTLTIKTHNVTIDDVFCATDAEAAPGAFVVLEVSDDGCGMDTEMQTHIFEPFYTTKGVGEGTGLGLATVYGIVMQNGGFIKVASELGSGTTFQIYFPRYSETEEVPCAHPGNSSEYCGAETILLVEDELSILNVASRVLKKQGYQVISANSPGEALRQIEQYTGDIHLVLTDVVMPEMNGHDLVERLHAIRPHLRCIYMSGYTASVIEQHGILEAGIHFLQKPFSIENLLAKVREVLDAPERDKGEEQKSEK